MAANPCAIERRPTPSGAASSCPFTSAARTIRPSRCTAGSEIAKSSMIASKVHRGPRWLSLIASILGASKGVALCRLASSSRSFSSTNKNSAWESTKRLINQGQATRSTLMSLRVIHFIFTSRSPSVCELDGEAIFIELWRVGGNQAGKALARSVDHKQVTVGTIIPAQTNVGTRALIVSSVHLQQCGEGQKSGE